MDFGVYFLIALPDLPCPDHVTTDKNNRTAWISRIFRLMTLSVMRQSNVTILPALVCWLVGCLVVFYARTSNGWDFFLGNLVKDTNPSHMGSVQVDSF